MRLVQHKKEAYYFYSFLSVFYDKLVNPLFWTERMREQSLDLAELDDPHLTVVDVGSGTGFTTQGIVRRVPARQVTCLDQSPHQLARAQRKRDLEGCTFQLGDAENLPFPTDAFDRYVSAGSIEYWPNPQRGVAEAYRVLKPGGVALMIGPLEPEQGLGRFFANTWMLFPKEQEYRRWFEEAGFTDLHVRYVRPHWFRRRSEYGLALAGRKPQAGAPLLPVAPLPPADEEKMTLGRRLRLIWRVLVGSLAGFVFIPAALWGYLRAAGRGEARERLNAYQLTALAVIALLLAGLLIVLLR
jgi:MPBQ/MSBQ methyltransferase